MTYTVIFTVIIKVLKEIQNDCKNEIREIPAPHSSLHATCVIHTNESLEEMDLVKLDALHHVKQARRSGTFR